MPLYMSKDRSTGAVRHFEAPNNRAVLLHLAAEMFAVERVKFETIAEAAPSSPAEPDADVEPAKRRGRPRRDESPGTPAPPPPSEALLTAEAARVGPPDPARSNRLFERMSDIAREARDNSPAPPLPPGAAEEGAAAIPKPAAAPEDEDEGAPTRPEPMFEE